jgi:hypothetical protein
VDSTSQIANKLYEYSDLIAGKSLTDDLETNTIGLSIEQKHLDFLDRLRRTQPKLYRRYLTFYPKLIQLPRTSQEKAIRQFIHQTQKERDQQPLK